MHAFFQTMSNLAYGTALLYVLALVAFALLLAFLVLWEKIERALEKRKQKKADDKIFGEIEDFYAGISDAPAEY